MEFKQHYIIELDITFQTKSQSSDDETTQTWPHLFQNLYVKIDAGHKKKLQNIITKQKNITELHNTKKHRNWCFSLW